MRKIHRWRKANYSYSHVAFSAERGEAKGKEKEKKKN
jgi:hypothetical protein